MLGRTYIYPIKRFSTVDPGRDGWNLYAYGAGNPVKFVDPDGQEAQGMNLAADEETLRQRGIYEDALIGMVQESTEDAGVLGFLVSYPFSLVGRMALSIGAPASNEEVAINAMALGAGARAPGVGSAARVGAAAGSRGGGALSKLKVDPKTALSGGRGGGKVKTLVGPKNAAVRGGGQRAFVTNDKGQVILDITKDRVKPVAPGQGFGPKRAPTQEELEILQKVLGGGS